MAVVAVLHRICMRLFNLYIMKRIHKKILLLDPSAEPPDRCLQSFKRVSMFFIVYLCNVFNTNGLLHFISSEFMCEAKIDYNIVFAF